MSTVGTSAAVVQIERPLLMSKPMVNGTVRGTKTETRRMTGLDLINEDPDQWLFTGLTTRDGYVHARFKVKGAPAEAIGLELRCPYGQPADLLWFRENWGVESTLNKVKPRDLPSTTRLFYEADGPPVPPHMGRLRPSIHLPRWASRIRVEIVQIGIDRVQEITEDSAQREGMSRGIFSDMDNKPHLKVATCIKDPGHYRDGFKYLWIELNGRISWNDNKWVWVVRYKLEHIGRK